MAIRAAQGAVFQRLHSRHSDDPIGVELVLYHDVLCSWCYVADARLDDPRLEQDVYEASEEAETLGIKGVPALVIGEEWLMQGCRELSEYREVIDKYLRERVAAAQVRTMH